MPRPPSDRVEEGFQIWSTEAERNDTRTAELMGLPQSTVSYWHRTYRWDERYLAFIQPDGELMAGVALAAMRAGLPAVTQRLLHIATAKKPVYDADGQPHRGGLCRPGSGCHPGGQAPGAVRARRSPRCGMV